VPPWSFDAESVARPVLCGILEPMDTAQTPPTPGPDVMVDLHFRVPRSWRDLLHEAAGVQRISTGDVLRILVRGFLSERYGARVDT
jgi:hypothetical protein